MLKANKRQLYFRTLPLNLTTLTQLDQHLWLPFQVPNAQRPHHPPSFTLKDQVQSKVEEMKSGSKQELFEPGATQDEEWSYAHPMMHNCGRMLQRDILPLWINGHPVLLHCPHRPSLDTWPHILIS